jgi:hypothetical protein
VAHERHDADVASDCNLEYRSRNSEAKALPLGGSFAGDCMEIEAVFSLEKATARRRYGGGGDRLRSREWIVFGGRG